MATTPTFPDGTTLQSSALQVAQVETQFQILTAQILGLNPNLKNPNDPAYSLVRIQWPSQGQPGFVQGTDYAFIRAVQQDAEWGKIFDESYTPIAGSAGSATQSIEYQRVWGVSWVFYGPKSLDHARLVRTCMGMVEWVHTSLAQFGLYVVPEMPQPIRTRELFQGNWWERADLGPISFNETVTDTLEQQGSLISEVLVYTSDQGLVADIKLPPKS